MFIHAPIAILGGTGPAGRGLAARLAHSGHEVLIGSRELAKSDAVVQSLVAQWGPSMKLIRPVTNEEAADSGAIVVLSTAATAAVEMAKCLGPNLRGKVLVSMASAIERSVGEFRPVKVIEGSLALAAQRAAPEALVAAALHHVPASALMALDQHLAGDVVVVADDERAKAETMLLIEELHDLQPFDGGSLANAVGLETFCATILNVNMRTGRRLTLRMT